MQSKKDLVESALIACLVDVSYSDPVCRTHINRDGEG